MPDQNKEIPPPYRKASSGPLALISFASLATAGGLGLLHLTSPSLANQLPETLGTVPGWITSGGIMGILGLLVYWQLGIKRIGVDERAAINVDSADIRDHYATEVSALRERLDEAARRHALVQQEVEGRYKALLEEAERRYRTANGATEEQYRRALEAAEKRHDDCVKDRDALRSEVSALQEEVAGLRRQFAAAGADRVIALGTPGSLPPSEPVVDSARRVKDIHAPRPRRRRGADKPPKS